jgi:predicted permease
MTWLARLRSTLNRWRRPDAIERALDAELRGYLQEDIDARIRAGESPAEARRQALVDLGGVETVKTMVRQRRAGAWLDQALQDVRYAIRMLRRSPASSWSVIGSVALGMAAMIVYFAFANAVLYRPTPGIKDPDRLIEVKVEYPESVNGWSALRISPGGHDALAAGLSDLGPVAAFDTRTVAVTLPAALSLKATLVTPNYFDVFGARLALGRPVGAGGDTRDGTEAAVLSHRLWTRELGADPAVIGRVIHVGGLPVTVAGVAAEDFTGPWDDPGDRPDLWLPLTMARRLNAIAQWPTAWVRTLGLAGHLRLVVRLGDGHDMPHATARAAALAARVEALDDRGGVALWAEAPQGKASGRRVVITPLRERVREFLSEVTAPAMLVPILVLVIACVNAANLLLARASDREREMAVRVAVGANRGRIVRQLLVESMLLAGASTVAAIPLVVVGVRYFERQFLFPMQPDAGVVVATLATVVLCAIAFGLTPALRAASRSAVTGLTHSYAGEVTPRQSFIRRALVVGQIVVSLALLGVGTQLIAVTHMPGSQGGTPPDRLLLASFDLGQANIPVDEADHFYDQVLARLSAHPDVEAAGLMFRGAGVFARHAPYGAREGRQYSGGHIAGDLFGAQGLKVVSGRRFTADDDRSGRPQSAIVSESFAAQVFQGQALGQILEVAADDTAAAMPVHIVGVVESAGQDHGRGAASVYLPVALAPEPARTLYVKSRSTATAIMPFVRDIVRDVDARVPFTKFRSQADDWIVDPNMSLAITLAQAGSVLGLIALALAAWGLYAVMSHSVATRSREFAVRLALGADTREILRLVGWQAGVLALVGGSIGTGAAVVIGVLVQANFQGTVAAGIGAHLLTTILLSVVMFVASFVPASRAARVSPLVLLKDG